LNKQKLFLINFSIVIILILSCSSIPTKAVILEGFTYSDSLVPTTEISWNVVKFDMPEGANWTIKTGYTVEKGDVIKIKLLADPDDFSFSTYSEPFETDEEWAEFYLNSASLGKNASALNLGTGEISSLVISLYIMPTTLSFDTSDEDTFEYFYDMMEPLQYDNESGYLRVSLTDDLFRIEWKYHFEGAYFFLPGTFSTDTIADSSYNIHTGVLDKLDVYTKEKYNGETEVMDLILLNTDSTQQASIPWITTVFGIELLVITILLKKRK